MNRTFSAIVVLAGLTAGTGCDGSPSAISTIPSARETRTAGPDRSTLVKPDPLSIQYSPATRTLELSAPPVPGARWLLILSAEPRGIPVDGVHQFPEMAEPDLDETAICYRTKQGQTSPQVTLREVIAAREYPISR